MQNYEFQTVQSVIEGKLAYCKFLSANDTGLTGGHQAGIYVSKDAASILFNQQGIKGENKSREVKIIWQGNLVTNSRFAYYGKETRDEYRITIFGKGFPYLHPKYTGALFVLVMVEYALYHAFVLNSEYDIDYFLNFFGLSPTQTNRLINFKLLNYKKREQLAIQQFINSLSESFPSSDEMSKAARRIHSLIYNHEEYIVTNPDEKLISWTDMEYELFKSLEHVRYAETIAKGFDSIDEFTTYANKVLNRRKSRAGKSLEHHLTAIFNGNNLRYSTQVVTENNKKVDFVFPSIEAYRDPTFPTEKIITLASKTTCKDRWRQILNEANRVRNRPKFLCTLQQGISPKQMDEMTDENVILVVPKPYIHTFPPNKKERIWSIQQFVNLVKELES